MSDNLCDRLESLHRQIRAELSIDAPLDAEKRRLLEQLQQDIAAALERCDDAQEHSLSERLNAAVDEFQISHPALTAALGRVMDILSRSGI